MIDINLQIIKEIQLTGKVISKDKIIQIVN